MAAAAPATKKRVLRGNRTTLGGSKTSLADGERRATEASEEAVSSSNRLESSSESCVRSLASAAVKSPRTYRSIWCRVDSVMTYSLAVRPFADAVSQIPDPPANPCRNGVLVDAKATGDFA